MRVRTVYPFLYISHIPSCLNHDTRDVVVDRARVSGATAQLPTLFEWRVCRLTAAYLADECTLLVANDRLRSSALGLALVSDQPRPCYHAGWS